MRHTELSMLNHLYIIDPNAVRHPQFCSRIEISAPEIILNDIILKDGVWQAFESEASTDWMSCTINNNNRDRTIQHIFTNVRTIPMWQAAKQCPVTVDGIYRWLCRWWHERFGVTYPVCTNESTGITYSHTHMHLPALAHPSNDLAALLNIKAFSICNGLVLALAMHRQGRWPEDIIHAALKLFVENMLDPEAPWTFITPFDARWVPFYEGHTAQLTEYPCHYALCGGVEDKVLHYMLRIANDPEPVTQHIHASRTKYTTYLATAFSAVHINGKTMSLREYNDILEYTEWPINPELHSPGDRTEPDWFGFARACVGRRGFWRAWRARPQWRRQIITGICASSDALRHAFSLMLPALFLLAGEACMDGANAQPSYVFSCKKPSRIRQLWKDVIHELDPEGTCIRAWTRAYIVRLWVTSAIGASHPHEVVMWSSPPIAFMRDVHVGIDQDVVATWMKDPATFTFLVRSSQCMLLQSVESRLGCKIEALPADPTLPNRSFTIRVALYDVLKQLALSEPIMRVYLERVVQRPIVSQLTTLYKIFGMGMHESKVVDAPDKYTIGQLMLEFFKRQKEGTD